MPGPLLRASVAGAPSDYCDAAVPTEPTTTPARRLIGIAAPIVALLWGFAEATLFFIVPDVLLSAVAIYGKRVAWWCAAFALGGAMIGGTSMYIWEHAYPGDAFLAVAQTPGATARVMDRAQREVMLHGPVAMIVGGVSFVPFKTYAVTAEAAGVSLPVFLLCGLVARGARFAMVTLIARVIVTRVVHGWSKRRMVMLHTGVWGIIYAVYLGWVVR